jgi:GNAT superfamily N-acetyltransferase
MQRERIRILVDRSRDASWSDALIDIEPDDVYQATDNRDYLKWSVLKNYDVLTICGYPILEYKDEEIQIIKKFVELGGGLLLASSTGRFERDVGKPISEMQLNKIANIFGAEFLPLSVCKAELEVDYNHIRGYHKKNLYLADRPVFADLYLDEIPFSNCGIISISGGAESVIYHNETLEPISACINFGKGRVLIINEVTFSQRSQRACNAFLDWLGLNRFSKVSGDERIPDEIPVDKYVKKDGNIEIHYHPKIVWILTTLTDKYGYDNDTKPVTEIEYDGADLKVYVAIEGHRIAHVFSSVDCNAYHFPDNTHITGVFIDWVSTEPEYRRIGLSRLAMQETFAHPSVKRCSCAFLTTRVENPAHAMYRIFGFVDQYFMEAFNFDIREEKVNVPEDIILRSYSPGDEVKMAEFANKCYSNSINVKRIKAIKKNDDIIKIAERNGEMLGYVLASTEFNRDVTNLKEICLQKTDEQFNIGSLLLRSLHNELFSRGYRSLTFWGKYGNRENLRNLLNTLGYSPRIIGGVKMFKIINLPMLLDEIIPLLTKRLMNSDYKDWRGKIGISGNQHKATIIIGNEICIAEDVYKDVNIHIQTDGDTITRIVIGRLTPYDAYLQRELTIKPVINDGVTDLLKTLFPKIPD